MKLSNFLKLTLNFPVFFANENFLFFNDLFFFEIFLDFFQKVFLFEFFIIFNPIAGQKKSLGRMCFENVTNYWKML